MEKRVLSRILRMWLKDWYTRWYCICNFALIPSPRIAKPSLSFSLLLPVSWVFSSRLEAHFLSLSRVVVRSMSINAGCPIEVQESYTRGHYRIACAGFLWESRTMCQLRDNDVKCLSYIFIGISSIRNNNPGMFRHLINPFKRAPWYTLT